MGIGLDLMHEDLLRKGYSEIEANRMVAKACGNEARPKFVIPDLETIRAHKESTEVLRNLLANSPAGLPEGHPYQERYVSSRNKAVAHLFSERLQ